MRLTWLSNGSTSALPWEGGDEAFSLLQRATGAGLDANMRKAKLELFGDDNSFTLDDFVLLEGAVICVDMADFWLIRAQTVYSTMLEKLQNV